MREVFFASARYIGVKWGKSLYFRLCVCESNKGQVAKRSKSARGKTKVVIS